MNITTAGGTVAVVDTVMTRYSHNAQRPTRE